MSSKQLRTAHPNNPAIPEGAEGEQTLKVCRGFRLSVAVGFQDPRNREADVQVAMDGSIRHPVV